MHQKWINVPRNDRPRSQSRLPTAVLILYQLKKYLQLELNEATSVVQIARVMRNHRQFDHEQAFSPNLTKALILEAVQMEGSLKRTAHFRCGSSTKTIYT